MSKFIDCFKFIYVQRKLLLSWRFSVLSISLLLALGWYLVTQIDWFNWLGLDLSSLPLPVYAFWLVVLVLSALVAYVSSPSEIFLFRNLQNAITDLRIIDAKQLIRQARKYYFLLPRSKIKLSILEACFYRHQKKLLESYSILKLLKNLTVLPWEQRAIDIEMMLLLFASGNYKVTQQEITRLQKGKLSKEQQFRCHQTQAELYIFDNQIQDAKDLLEEQLYNTQPTPSMQVALFHTLAVAETHQQNYQLAASNYRQAWEVQKKLKNSFAQAEITVSNLALIYSEQDQAPGAQPFIEELKKLAGPQHVDQQMAIYNLKLTLARQLSDRQAIIDTYVQSNEQLLPQLCAESKFFIEFTSCACIGTIKSILKQRWFALNKRCCSAQSSVHQKRCTA